MPAPLPFQGLPAKRQGMINPETGKWITPAEMADIAQQQKVQMQQARPAQRIDPLDELARIYSERAERLKGNYTTNQIPQYNRALESLQQEYNKQKAIILDKQAQLGFVEKEIGPEARIRAERKAWLDPEMEAEVYPKEKAPTDPMARYRELDTHRHRLEGDLKQFRRLKGAKKHYVKSALWPGEVTPATFSHVEVQDPSWDVYKKGKLIQKGWRPATFEEQQYRTSLGEALERVKESQQKIRSATRLQRTADASAKLGTGGTFEQKIRAGMPKRPQPQPRPMAQSQQPVLEDPLGIFNR